MAIKISGEPIINDDRFIVSPIVQKITANKTLVKGYQYRTASSALIIEPNVILTIEPQGSVGGIVKDNASLTIERGADAVSITS